MYNTAFGASYDTKVKNILTSKSDKYPLAIKNCKELSRLEKDVMLGLLDYMQEGPGWDSCRPGHQALATKVGCSRRSIVDCMASLRAKGFIDWRTRPQDTNVYRFTSKIFDFHPDFQRTSSVSSDPFPMNTVSFNALKCEETSQDCIYNNINIITPAAYGAVGLRELENLPTKEKSPQEKEFEIFLDTLGNLDSNNWGKEKENSAKEKEMPVDTAQQFTPAPENNIEKIDYKASAKKTEPEKWFIRPEAGEETKKAFMLGDKIKGVPRESIEQVHAAFVGAMTAKNYPVANEKISIYEYTQVADMIIGVGLQNALDLMPYVVKNWDDLCSSTASKSDAEKLSHFPEPSFNPVLAKWRWKMWTARMTGKVSERTRKRKEKKLNQDPKTCEENLKMLKLIKKA